MPAHKRRCACDGRCRHIIRDVARCVSSPCVNELLPGRVRNHPGKPEQPKFNQDYPKRRVHCTSLDGDS